MKGIHALLVTAALVTLGSGAASAQETFPNRPIKVLVPYGPGGATDIAARIVGEEFQKITGQPMIILNKPGAYGLLAIEEMAKSPADGYTVMVGNVSTNAVTPVMFAKKMSFDYLKSVVAVTNLIDVPAFMLATTANGFPPRTVKEFIDYARKNRITYGTVGVGSYPHLDFAYFAKRANLDMASLPNKAGAPGTVTDMLRGDAQAAFLNVASTGAQVQAGNLRALAVINRTRLKEYPDVPTMQEVGFDDVGTVAWNAMFAPSGTPAPILKALHDAVKKAMASPEAKDKFARQFFNVVPSPSVEEAQVWLAGELKHWEKVTSQVQIEMP